MNCSQVQERIWCGDLQPDVHMHLATCDACREEHQRVQEVNQEIEHTYIPLPTRSLLPPREEIEQAVRRSKKSRFPAWMTTVTVAAAILLAFTQAGSLWPNTVDNSTASNSIPELQAPVSRSKNAPQSLVTPAEGTVTIDPGSNPAFREETESIRAFLRTKFNPEALRGLTIESYTRDTLQADIQTGRLALWVQNQPGQISDYGKGDRPFRIQQYLELQKIQGLWTVTRTSTIPFDFVIHGHTNYRIALPTTWQTAPTSSGALLFRQNGQTLGGITRTPLQKGEADPLKAVQLPANTSVIQAGLESYRTEDAVKYLLKRTTAATNPSTLLEVHTYFLRGNVAYDVWLTNDTAFVPAETALAVTNSFETIQ